MKNNISSQKCRFVKNFYKPHRMYHKHKKTIFHLKNVFVAQFYWPNKAYLTKFLSKIWAKTRKNISLGNDCQKSKMEESKTGPEYNFTISGVLNSYLELVWQRYPIFFIFPIFHIFKFLPICHTLWNSKVQNLVLLTQFFSHRSSSVKLVLVLLAIRAEWSS